MAFRRDKVLAAAEKYAAKGQHDKAAKEYQAIVDDDPKDIRSWLLLADCLVRSGEREKAIDKYLRVGKFYTQGKAPQKALAVYRQVLTLDPGRVDVHLKCAHLFRELGQTPDAVLIFEKVARVYDEQQRTSEAAELYLLVVDIEPRNVAKRLRLAEFYSKAKLVDEAVEQFDRCGDVLREDGRLQEYIRVAERLLYHKPVEEVLRKLASVYLELNEPRRALMKLNTLLQQSPSEPKNLELFAETFVALGKKDKAISVMLELARGERGKGAESESNAIRVLQKALQWDPGNASVTAALAALGGAPAEDDEDEDDIEEIEELDAEEIEELDADDLEDLVELDEEEASGLGEPGVPAPVERSLTKEVMSEVSTDEVQLEAEGDVDKVLHEVKVLFKYRLFEHALSYLDAAFEQDAEHVGALELKADLLSELGRSEEAAEAHVHVARLVRDRDPAKAARHARQALEVTPDHSEAGSILASVGDVDDVETEERPALEVDLEGAPADSDAAAVPEAIEPEIDTGVLDDAFGEVEFGDDEDEILIDDSDDEVGVPEVGVLDESGLIVDDVEMEAPPELDEGLEIPDNGPAPQEKIEVSPAESGVSLSLADPGLADDLGVDVSWDEDDEIISEAPEDPLAEDSAEFAISVDTEPEVEPEPEPVAIEDRFGLEGDDELEAEAAAEVEAAPPVEAEPAQDWADISDEMEEVEFFLGRGLVEDARFAFEDLAAQYPGHPVVLAMAAKLSGEAEEPAPPAETAPAQAVGEALAEDVDSPTPSGAEAPLSFEDEDDDADDYLAAIFDEGPKEEKSVQHQARAQIDDADAGTHFDLGTAYREMGLIDDALAEFEAAANDARWKAKALVMMASLRLHRGETDAAIESLEGAIAAARTSDEKSEAYYELGLIYETIGDAQKAVVQFEQVEDGFRDKEEKLQSLR